MYSALTSGCKDTRPITAVPEDFLRPRGIGNNPAELGYHLGLIPP